MAKQWLVGGLVLLSVLPVAAAATVPYDVQVPLLLKALTYDRSLKTRAGDAVRIAIVMPAKSGRGAVDDLQAAVQGLPDRTVNGLPVSFREVTAEGGADLEQALQGGRWAAAIIMPGFGPGQIGEFRRVCASRQVLAVAAEVGDVERGLAFGVGAQGGKPQIVVNLPTVKACGSDFDLALLRLSKVLP
jgi:hypothetical protein